MIYTKFQKFISSFLIFSLLFSITFRVPFFDFFASASWNQYYDLVSIIVDEKTYSKISSELNKYSKDITNVLENTKVVILPFPDDASTYDIASMNEALFYDWYNSLSDVTFESKLIWSVFIWNIPLPEVYKNNEVSKTILPYTDFEDKSYIFNTKTSRYEYNKDNITWIKPEIWHWVISPNTWDFDSDIDSLKDYFSKNHDFYTWKWLYDLEKNSVNWNLEEWLNKDYEPYVFYFDAFRESKSINYNSYVWYKAYLENKEDLVYNRFTKDLANKLKQELLSNNAESISSLAKKVDSNIDTSLLNSVDTTLNNIPDIQSRYIINNSVKKFIEIFSPGSISEMRKNVYNAWRYNYWQEVNVDFIPYFISVLDIVNDQILKELSDDLELQVDNLVANWLSRKIAIPTHYTYDDPSTRTAHQNYLYWKKASTINEAVECSYYRWSLSNSWQLVESNRGTNVYNIEPDKNSLSPIWTVCFTNLQSWKSLEWFWWRNSPFNLNQSESSKWNIVLNNNADYKWAIVSLYDIDWSKKINDTSKVPTPFFCTDNNYLLADKWEYVLSWETGSFENTYKLPTFSNSLNINVPWWSCLTDNNTSDKVFNFTKTFEQNFLTLTGWSCELNKIYLNWEDEKNVIKTVWPGPCITETETTWEYNNYYYKTIDSFVKHKSPTPTELSSQINSMVAPSLAVDKDRYIDFISADWSYVKINYPYLYRLKLKNISDISLDKVSQELDNLLDEKSKEINQIITENNPSNGRNSAVSSKFVNNSWVNKYLSTWSYPSSNFDFKKYLKNKPTKTITISWESKTLSYYDMLVFAIYWNNLNSVSSKYWFVFENYLSNQFDNSEKYFLPKNKKTYEIAYLWAPWDTSNMYVWVDPESKNTNPYSDIIWKNQDISAKLLWLNIWRWSNSQESIFKCAPPEWVPLWEWIPAIMCRLADMVPPTISISDWACWPSLLSNEEKQTLKECNWDVNKNWVNDCLESKLTSWSILLESDSLKYFYNKNASLKATLKWSDWKDLTYLNSTNLSFEIVKVETKSDLSKDLSENNKKVIYDINDIYKKDKSVLNNYLNFKDITIRVDWGIAKYGISFKDKDLNVYLRSKVVINDNSNKNVVDLESNILKLEVRWESLFLSSFLLENKESSLTTSWFKSSVLVSDKANVFILDWYKSTIDESLNLINNSSISKEKLVIRLENISSSRNFLPISYPINVQLFNKDKLIQNLEIDNLTKFKSLFSLQKSWTYTLKIRDKAGLYSEKTFEVLPDLPSKLDLNLGTNYLQADSSVSTNYFTILDKFDNPTSGSFYDVKMSIDGKSLVFVDNDKDNFTTTTYEWYKIFRLKSNSKVWDNNLTISVLDSSWKIIVSESKKISVLQDFDINTKSLNWDIYIWWWKYKYQIDVRDKSWKIINNLNSRVYMTANSNYIELEKPYFEVVNWVWVVEFSTKTLAWRNIPVQIQIEWLWKIVTQTIDILPEKAMKIDLVLSKNKLDASSNDYSTVNIELKDRYNNLVFNDNSTKVDIEILPEYTHILTFDKKTNNVIEWKTSFKVYSTINPWIWYFKVSTNPSLALNTFSIEDESWKLEVVWVWENAAKIETFYIWNKDKISKSSYNSIYTTLLWASYWDIEQKDYLAWSLIFDKNSKALAVTSIVNNPYSYNNVFSISNNWWVNKLYAPNDLSQDINLNVSFKDTKLYIDLFNSSLNTNIWEIHYVFPKKVNLKVCDTNISDCIDNKSTSIVWKNTWSNFKFYNVDSKLYLRDELWKTYIEIDDKWNIIRRANIDFDIISSNANYLEISLKSGSNIVWYLVFNFIDSKINISRDKSSFDTKLKTIENSIMTYIESSFYGSYINWKDKNESLIIYYNDPFSSKDSLNTFSKWDNSYFENFKQKWWLWWGDTNKTLLSFSSWRSVWESLKENMSFSSINIWDPVISLKQIRKTFNNSPALKQFDSTIWDLVSDDDDLVWYRIFDYNNDSREDILLVKYNGYLKLLQNSQTESRFLDMWNLAHIVDLWNHELIKVWDFTWDSYSDIFFVWEDWKPYLLNNINKDFSRISLSNKFNLNWKIIRAESFDMDNDGIFDIVTLDDAWEINIFYWINWTTSNPTFTKLNVSKDYWLTLNKDIRNDWGLIYYDWLYQVDTTYNNSDLLKANEKYLSELEKSLKNWTKKPVQEKVDYELVNSFIFEQIAYSKKDSISLDDIKSIDSLVNLPQTINQTTFIKSDYSEAAWVRVEKIFLDRNGEFLSTWDIVDVEIKVTNISWKKLENFVYVEDVLDYFTLDQSTIFNSKNLQVKKPNNTYDFLIDGFSLSWNETITIKYSWLVKPLKYSQMQVWLFEKWESWDDNYWDIILKDTIENCWTPVEIFRSVSTRLYNKWLKNPVCDNTPLPEELQKNTLDTDWNWVPDYIDNLTNNVEALRDYSKETLSKMFSDMDNDGIPDDEDSFNFNWALTLDLWTTWSSIDSWLDNIQNFVNALSCWFNNGSCITMPLNWAPLAPGNDPVFNGNYLLDDLNIDEGIPIFSALTWMPIYVPACVPIPTVWPVSSSAIWSACSKWVMWMDWAWWYLWIDSPTNFFRLSVTPTLTGWVWMSACFWAPASIAWNAMMPWLAPLFPGWNCIVVAKPIVWCSNDWSDGNPASKGYPIYGNNFWVINWNCSSDTQSYIDQKYVNNYYNYITWKWNYSSLWSVKNAVWTTWNSWSWPLFSIWWWSGTPISVSVDPTTWDVDFSDVTKIVKKRIQAFPWFLMNWVTRQIEEIANKLTDFPTLFVILPDFSWIYDTDLDWEQNKTNWLNNSWNKNRSENDAINLDNISNPIDTSKITNSTLKWLASDANNLTSQWVDKAKQYSSWIKEAYEFLWSLPLVKIEQATVDMSLPWVSLTEIDKTIFTRQATLDSRKAELNRATSAWTLWKTCNFTNPDEQKRCNEENALAEKVNIDASNLVNSLEANLQVLKTYKEIPEKINKYINKKEYYLEQILCNIEWISSMLGWRIWSNWERFKAWVELFILMKSILKSWQLLIDVFVDYEQECKECKNERQDAMQSEFEIISMVVPEIPVIQFPKWPDIILDMHNIRASLNIILPEFSITPRPILLPELPKLYLPNTPYVDITFPTLPILPTIELPELPDLPSLPTVELPDLPPPPTLPKMLSSLEVILDVLKLVTKAMCILKSSPFHPEWRAWDQIAFLTERSWYLPTDFLNLSLPQFSFPFVDAIQVTTYVNLEFDVDFLVEMARQVAMPINSFTSDFTNIFNINIADLDFRSITPSNINIDVWNNEINNNVWFENNKLINDLVISIVNRNVLKWIDFMSKNRDVTVSNNEFKKLVLESLSSEKFTRDPRFEELIYLWNNVANYSFSKEDKIISELKQNNFDKFETLKDIVNTEIIKNKELKKSFNNSLSSNIKKVSYSDNSNVVEYNSMLDKYNSKVFQNTDALLNQNEENSYRSELKEMWNDLVDKLDTALWSYRSTQSEVGYKSSQIFAATTNLNTTNSDTNSCNAKASGDYSYVYEWIYILENNKSYRLFDYKDELVWNETTTIIDFDKDSDEDLLYFANNVLYLKENLDKKSSKVYLNENPLVVDIEDNKFLNWADYISSIDNARSNASASWIINIGFDAKNSINNYRLEFYNVVDKFLNQKYTNYSPIFRKKSILDSVSWIWTINLVQETDNYKELKDIVYIDNVWDLKWLQVITDDFSNIKTNIDNWNVVTLSNQTKVYSWNASLVLKYVIDWNSEIKTIVVPKNRYIEVQSTINIVWITWNWYIQNGSKKIYEWNDIRTLIWMPLLPWTKISYIWNNYEVKDTTYIELKYYDDSELSLNFKYISDWELYNLWYESQRYLISTKRNNDYYYSKISSFKNNIVWTFSSQLLLSPQLQADNNSPELTIWTIRVPVYQKQTLDLTRYIYEDTWISKIFIDFDLEKDTSGDGNSKNDQDSDSMENLKISIVDDKIILDVWVFDNIFTKKVWFTIIDLNWNKSYKEVGFEIYSPTPEISNHIWNDISWFVSEDLTNEPVSLYRVRWWMISKLSNNSWENTVLTNSWTYNFNVWTLNSWLKIEKNNVLIANVSEKTWKINLLDSKFSIEVISSNNSSNKDIYPKIVLKDWSEDIFYETIKVNWNKTVNVLDNFDNVNSSWVYVKFLNTTNYNYYITPENVSYNPWSLVIYRINDDNKEPLFIIFNDWRINTLNSNYLLKYDYYKDYVVIKLFDKNFSREVASVLYKVDSDYIIK